MLQWNVRTGLIYFVLQRQRSLAEVRAAAEAEMERSAARRDGILEERDRALEQVRTPPLLMLSIYCPQAAK